VVQNIIVAIAIAMGVYVLLRMIVAWRSRVPPAKAHAEVAAGALLLDVRTEGEFRGGSLPKAKNIPLPSLGSHIAELSKERPIVVFCASGMRSARAASILRAQGFTVHDLGPLSAW